MPMPPKAPAWGVSTTAVHMRKWWRREETSARERVRADEKHECAAKQSGDTLVRRATAPSRENGPPYEEPHF